MACAKLTFSAPDTIPLDCLELSDGNVRRIKPAIPIQSLADSIARRGSLQSLSVRPILDDNGGETGCYRVQAGSRRLETMQLLVTQKRLAKNAPIHASSKPMASKRRTVSPKASIASPCIHSISFAPLPPLQK